MAALTKPQRQKSTPRQLTALHALTAIFGKTCSFNDKRANGARRYKWWLPGFSEETIGIANEWLEANHYTERLEPYYVERRFTKGSKYLDHVAIIINPQ